MSELSFGDLSFINDFYGLNLEEDQIFYYETISDFSWSSSLLIYKVDNRFFVIEDDTEVRAAIEDECLDLMLEFEKEKRC